MGACDWRRDRGGPQARRQPGARRLLQPLRDRTVPSSEQRQCDINDGLFDGVTTFSSVPPGTHFARFEQFPAGPYGWTGERREFTVSGSGAGVTLTYQLEPARTAAVTMVNSAGQLMLGYCVQILIGSGSHVYHPCDEHDGTMDGVVHFFNLPNLPDQRAAADTPYPPNYLPGPEVPLVFDANGHAEATYVWVPEGGSVRANLSYEDGGLLFGEQACFELLRSDGSSFAIRCANAATQTLVFDSVPLGSYSVAVAYFDAFCPRPAQPTTPDSIPVS